MWQDYTYTDAAGSHPYFVYTPATYRVGTPVPLIVMLHGCAQTAADFAAGTRMNLLAERSRFIVAYPQQTRNHNRTLCWNWFKPSSQTRDRGEPAMIAGIVQEIRQNSARWTIDPERVYAAGLSAGATMTAILGATYPDLFAAIGMHSGLAYRAATNTFEGLRAMRRGGPDPVKQGQAAYVAMGASARAVPCIVFHGTGDSLVSPINSDKAVQQWLHTNHLALQGTDTLSFDKPSSMETDHVRDGHTYTVYKWTDSQGREILEYWKVDHMGHGWSGGSTTGSFAQPSGPDASLAMYQFFMRHPMKIEGEDEQAPWWNLRSMRELFLKHFRSTSPEPPL